MDAELFDRASAVRANAHAPYSRFAVGAAIRAEDGSLHVGANVENAAYPQGWCAETSAIASMVSQGATPAARRIATIVVVAERIEGGMVCTPCGGCRQKLKEFSTPRTMVECIDPSGEGEVFFMADLLPAAFSLEQPTG